MLSVTTSSNFGASTDLNRPSFASVPEETKRTTSIKSRLPSVPQHSAVAFGSPGAGPAEVPIVPEKMDEVIYSDDHNSKLIEETINQLLSGSENSSPNIGSEKDTKLSNINSNAVSFANLNNDDLAGLDAILNSELNLVAGGSSGSTFSGLEVSKIPEFKPKGFSNNNSTYTVSNTNSKSTVDTISASVSNFLSDSQIRTWWSSQCEERPEFRGEDVFNKYGSQYGVGTTLKHTEQTDLKCRIIGSKFSENFGKLEAVYILELCSELAEESDLLSKNDKTLEAGVVEVHQHWDWLLVGPPVRHNDGASKETIASLGQPVLPCMRGGRTLLLSMDHYDWTEDFYLNNSWARWEHAAYCDRQRWNRDWVMAGENVLLEYEIIIVDDKFLDCEWDSFSPAFKTYFLGGGGVILLAHNNRPNLIPKLNNLIGCNWTFEGLQRADHEMHFEVTPRCRQLYEKPEAPLDDVIQTRNVNLITVPARERLLKALPEEDFCEDTDKNTPEEDKFHNLPDEFTPCGVHYGQLHEGAARPGMLAFLGCGNGDEHEFWFKLFREIVAQRIEKQKKRRRRQKKNKKTGNKNSNGDSDDEDENGSHKNGSGNDNFSKNMNNRSNSRDIESANDNSVKNSKNMNMHNKPISSSSVIPSFFPKHAASKSSTAAGSDMSSIYHASMGALTSAHTSSQSFSAHLGTAAAAHSFPTPGSSMYNYTNPASKYSPTVSPSEYSPTSRKNLEAYERKRAEEEMKRRLYTEDLLNFGAYNNYDPTKYRILNQIVICRDHFAYVNELPNGQIVQYQQAGTISYFFVGDDIYAKPLGGEYKWHSKKTTSYAASAASVSPPHAW